MSVFLVPCAFRRGDQCDLAPILEHTRSVHSTGTHTQIPGATQLRPRDARRLPCVALGHTPIVGSSPVAGDAAQRDTHQIPCEAPTTGTHTNFLCTQPRLHGGSQTRTHIDFLESMCVPVWRCCRCASRTAVPKRAVLCPELDLHVPQRKFGGSAGPHQPSGGGTDR